MRYNRYMIENFNGNDNGGKGLFSVKLPSSHVGGAVFSLSALLIFIVAAIMQGILSACGIEKNTDLFTYLNYLVAPIAIVPAISFVLYYKKIKFKTIFPVRCHPKYYLIAITLIFGLLFFAAHADLPFIELFKALGYQQRKPSDYFPDLSGGYIVLALFIIAVMPALVEETLFRGIILNTCEDSLGTVRTIFIVGFSFALFHASPEQTVYQFIAGCAFAFLALRSGSILPSVLMHFINNALIIVFKACGLFDSGGNLILSDLAFILITVFAGLAFIGSVVWLILDKKPLKKAKSGGVKWFFAFASIGILLMSINWISSFFTPL